MTVTKVGPGRTEAAQGYAIYEGKCQKRISSWDAHAAGRKRTGKEAKG